jgi:hypothetical protein
MIFLLLPLLICCNYSQNDSVRGKNASIVSGKYSKEAYSYFYEVCFFDEVNMKKVHLAKWKEDIKYYVTGDASEKDVEMVMRSLNKLNNLKLPIDFSLVSKSENSNVIIHFGDTVSLKPLGLINNFEGVSIIRSSKGIINNAKILISDHSATIEKKESVILEEMTQIIGLRSDSYTYPESLFYQGVNSATDYLPIDVEVIQLLYDSLIPVNYCIEDYERDFGDVINYCNTSNKLREIFSREGIKSSTLEDIRQACYFDSGFYKHPKKIPVYLNGFDQNDSIFVFKALTFFNGLSTNVNLKFDGKPDDLNSTGISIKLVVNDSQEYPTETSISNTRGEVLKPKRIKSEAEISYRSSVEVRKKRSVILKAIYKCLGPTEMHFEDDWFTYDGERVVVNQKYADIIRIIYSDEFVDGYPLEEFEELIEEL